MAETYKPGDKIGGKYLVKKRLGKGGMGRVVKVQRITDGKTFALKYCIKARDIDLRRFAREVRLMTRIKHDNIIKIVDHDLDDTPPWFVMPLAKHSLREEIPEFKADENKRVSN